MLQPRYLLMINPPPGCISSFRTFREYIQEELRKANQRQRVIGLHMSTSNNPPGRGCPSNFCIDDLAGGGAAPNLPPPCVQYCLSSVREAHPPSHGHCFLH